MQANLGIFVKIGVPYPAKALSQACRQFRIPRPSLDLPSEEKHETTCSCRWQVSLFSLPVCWRNGLSVSVSVILSIAISLSARFEGLFDGLLSTRSGRLHAAYPD